MLKSCSEKISDRRYYHEGCLIVLILLMMFLPARLMRGQCTLNTGGAQVGNSIGSMSFSLGQSFFMTHPGSAFCFSEGIQIPYSTILLQLPIVKGVASMVYPNPFHEQLFVELPAEMDQAILRLYDLKGILLSVNQVVKGKNVFDYSNLESGQYLAYLEIPGVRLFSYVLVKE